MVTRKIKFFENIAQCITYFLFYVNTWVFFILYYVFLCFLVDNSEVEEVDNREDDAMIPETQRGVPLPPPPPLINQDGLIIPRKLHNPVLHNGERQNLHREMLFNHKMWAY